MFVNGGRKCRGPRQLPCGTPPRILLNIMNVKHLFFLSFFGQTLKYLIDLGCNSLSTRTISIYCSVVKSTQKSDKDCVKILLLL